MNRATAEWVGGCGHRLFSTQLYSLLSMVAKEQTQHALPAVSMVDQNNSVTVPSSCLQVGHVGGMTACPRVMRRWTQ